MGGDGRRGNRDETFGSNVRIHRERLKMSQAALAEAMTEKGWPWHQSTVYRVEHGKQVTGYWEARSLAEVLQTSADRFAWPLPEASATEYVYAAGSRLRQRYEEVAQAVQLLLMDHDGVGRVLEQHKDSKYERVREAVDDVAARMGEYGLDEAIDEGVRRHEFPEEG